MWWIKDVGVAVHEATPLRRFAVLLVLALGTWQTGGVHDVVRHLDEALAGQDWPLADSAKSIFSTQWVLPEALHHCERVATTSKSSAHWQRN